MCAWLHGYEATYLPTDVSLGARETQDTRLWQR